MKNHIILFLVPFLLCGSMNQLRSQAKKSFANETSTKDQIVYLFFKVSKNNSGSEKITLEEIKRVDGKLKSKPELEENEVKKGDYIVTLKNADGKSVEKHHIENPLNPELENFADQLSRHTVSLTQAEFSIRYSFSADITSIQIEKVSEKGTHLLFTQNIQP